MKSKITHTILSKLPTLKGKIDRGTIFIVAIMICLMFLGYIMVGGTIPEEIPAPRSTGIMSVDLTQKYPQELSLQMHTFPGETITPYPTLGGAAPLPDEESITQVDCGDSTAGLLPDLIWAYRVSSTPASGNQSALQVFYSGADAVSLGTAAMTSKPTQHLSNPPTTTTNKDANGLPISAAVFVTDITANPADVSGDGTKGGVPQFPSDIYGAWKTETGLSSNVPNNQSLGTGADLWPPASGAGGGASNSSWTAELIWPIGNLKTKTGAALAAGKTYRIQVILHTGTANNQIGEACFTYKPAAVKPYTPVANPIAAPAAHAGGATTGGNGNGGSNSPGALNGTGITPGQGEGFRPQ